MAIRDHWNRMVRKSARSSSSSSGGRSEDGQAEPTTFATTTAPTAKTTSRPAAMPKMPSWRSTNNQSTNHTSNNNTTENGHKTNHSDEQHKKHPTKPSLMHRPRSLFSQHPMYRRPTEENLRWQESLGTYTMQFGRSRPSSRGGGSSCSGISPCASRAGSLDYGVDRRMSSVGPMGERIDE